MELPVPSERWTVHSVTPSMEYSVIGNIYDGTSAGRTGSP